MTTSCARTARCSEVVSHERSGGRSFTSSNRRAAFDSMSHREWLMRVERDATFMSKSSVGHSIHWWTPRPSVGVPIPIRRCLHRI